MVCAVLHAGDMKARTPGGPLLIAASVVAVASACTLPSLEPIDVESTPAARDAGPPEAPPADLDDLTLGLVAGGAYATSSLFTHVSHGPYPSAAAAGSFVDVWVTSGASAAYEAISPDGGAVDAGLPLGAVIVRAVSDATGAVTKLTVMRHGPSGFDPTVGDWWFAETDPTGIPLSDDGGLLVGALSQCSPCHVARESDAFLFGVPPSAR